MLISEVDLKTNNRNPTKQLNNDYRAIANQNHFTVDLLYVQLNHDLGFQTNSPQIFNFRLHSWD